MICQCWKATKRALQRDSQQSDRQRYRPPTRKDLGRAVRRSRFYDDADTTLCEATQSLKIRTALLPALEDTEDDESHGVFDTLVSSSKHREIFVYLYICARRKTSFPLQLSILQTCGCNKEQCPFVSYFNLMSLFAVKNFRRHYVKE